MSFQEKCDSLVQTDISIVLTPQQEQMPLYADASSFSASAGPSTTTATPRPSSLPGLVSAPDKLFRLAGKVVLTSPTAPTQVKAYARTLVEGIITDTIVQAAASSTTTAAAGAAAAPCTSPNTTDISQSSQLETDSLDERDSPKKVQLK